MSAPGKASGARVTLRDDDREIIAALADGPLSAREIAHRIRRKAQEQWSAEHGYFFEWGTDEEPLGAALLAHTDARHAGWKLLTHEIDPRLRSLEKRGAVERIQIGGQRPMLWSRRV